ncbi:MAG: DUF1513 domain-containing protein, partial [Ruegeria sp.]
APPAPGRAKPDPPAACQRTPTRTVTPGPAGRGGFAMRGGGAPAAPPPLLGLHRRGEPPRLLTAPEADQRRLNGYAGSVAFSQDGQTAAITSPRGGALHLFDVASGDFTAAHMIEDVCGLGPGPDGLIFTAGTGAVGQLTGAGASVSAQAKCQWDNHLVRVPHT